MKEVLANGKKIMIYDSITNLPAWRFNLYNRYLVLDSGIGSDLQSINSHIANIARMIETSPSDAIKGLQNMQQAMYFTMNNVSLTTRCFVALIYSIEGKVLRKENFSEEGVARICDILHEENVTTSWIEKQTNFFKKKAKLSLRIFSQG